MITYEKNGRPARTPTGQDEEEGGEPKVIRVNGFQQVLEMLQVADPEFRESLLRRLAQRDPVLYKNLREKLQSR